MSPLQIIAAIVAILAVLASAALIVNRPVYVRVDAETPAGFPARGFSHQLFEDLLAEFVDEAGRVDYERWHVDHGAIERLDSYLAAVAAYSPETTPERFPDRYARLAYWMTAYNANVIRSVLRHWPISSVMDVRAPLEVVSGLGFFYRQRFAFGGRYLSLYEVENERIRKAYRDPRVHFILNCGSESCPVLPTHLSPDGDLERQLGEAAVAFVTDPANVLIDHEAGRLILSNIFKMYRGDFIAELRAQGQPASGGLHLYLKTIAPEPLARELQEATNYDIEFREFDWSVNDTGP